MVDAVGFIGLGQMGCPMAANLLAAGLPVRGFDLRAENAAPLRDKPGFTACATAAEAADADVVILMLPDSKVVDALLWEQGLADRLRPGSCLIDMGSSAPMRSLENARRLAERGIAFVDAPVSGGVKRAIPGTLAIMIGGEAAAVARVLPVLEKLGTTRIHVGPAGAGHAVKALNNYVSAAGLLAVCEALDAAQRFGIDPKVVNQVFNASTGKNNTTEVKVEPFMLSGTFGSGFALALMRKDIETAEDFVRQTGAVGEFAQACVRVWRDAERTLPEKADHTAMYTYVRERA